MRARLLTSLLSVTVLLLTLAPAAFARQDGGQGWYGETTDSAITNVMFGVIIFFPLLITVLSLIQGRLNKRQHDRYDAMRAREQNVDWRGGW